MADQRPPNTGKPLVAVHDPPASKTSDTENHSKGTGTDEPAVTAKGTGVAAQPLHSRTMQQAAAENTRGEQPTNVVRPAPGERQEPTDQLSPVKGAGDFENDANGVTKPKVAEQIGSSAAPAAKPLENAGAGAPGQDGSGSKVADGAELHRDVKTNASWAKTTNGAEMSDKDAAVEQRLDEMRHEGHGPQRHQGDVMSDGDAKLHGRLGDYDRDVNGDLVAKRNGYRVKGKQDPETRTTADKYNGGKHRCGSYATAIPESTDYVQAEKALHRYADQLQAEPDGSVIVAPPNGPTLRSAYGDDCADKCVGKMLDSDRSEPGAPHYKDVDFTDGTLGGVLFRQSDGTYTTKTLYANPLAANNPLRRKTDDRAS